MGAGGSASRAAKKAPPGLFCPAERKRRAAAVRIHLRGREFGFLQKKKTSVFSTLVFLVGAGGFEPPKLKAADLQSVPIGHSGTRPYSFRVRCRTTCLVYHRFLDLSTSFFISFSFFVNTMIHIFMHASQKPHLKSHTHSPNFAKL